ncbi:hypothetical protein PXW76_27920, partial [Klebsiella pneumoniae]|uniref:hypothetical protein n=1 Tax=Klebsiella pneumoniae TaxID=573 RepID=UPI002381857E
VVGEVKPFEMFENGCKSCRGELQYIPFHRFFPFRRSLDSDNPEVFKNLKRTSFSSDGNFNSYMFCFQM